MNWKRRSGYWKNNMFAAGREIRRSTTEPFMIFSSKEILQRKKSKSISISTVRNEGSLRDILNHICG